MDGPRGAIGGAADEKKKLVDMVNAHNAIIRERKAITKRVNDQTVLELLASPFQNFNDSAKLLSGDVALADIKEQIAIQRARLRIASKAAIPGVLASALKNLGQNAIGSIGSGVGGLFQQNSLFGLPMPSIAKTIANDLNAGGVMQLFEGLNGIVQAVKPFAEQQQNSPALGATESRFLTRGRGQLDPAAKKQAEDNAKQLAELKGIRNAIAGLGENMLVVEGVA